MTKKRAFARSVSVKPTWVWNWEGFICAFIFAADVCGNSCSSSRNIATGAPRRCRAQIALTALAEHYGVGNWVMRAVTTWLVYYVWNEWKNWNLMFSSREPRSHPDCISHVRVASRS